MQAPQSDPAVQKFMDELDHPLKLGAETVRQIILSVSPEIQEGIKWNSMSFRTTEWFATFNWRKRDRIEFVFHLGAKVKDGADTTHISDPENLLDWLAKDRCLLILREEDPEAKRSALEAVVREWIRHV